MKNTDKRVVSSLGMPGIDWLRVDAVANRKRISRNQYIWHAVLKALVEDELGYPPLAKRQPLDCSDPGTSRSPHFPAGEG